MTNDAIPAPPAGSSAAAKRLWSSVLEEFALDEHELVLLTQAARITTTLDRLDADARRDGVTVATTNGASKPSPCVVEARQQAISLARVLAALRLPAGAAGDHQAHARPQRHVGVRGIHALPGGRV